MSAVAAIIEAYGRAVLDKDVEGLMRLYDPSVRVFDAWGVWSYEGADAWRKTVASWFGSLGDETVRVTFDDLQVVEGESLCTATAIVTYAGISAAQQPLRAMQNRLTWTLRRAAGEWKIVHEHTSAPIDFDHFKAILQRSPS